MIKQGYKLEAGDLPILPDDSAPIGMLAWDYYRYTYHHVTDLIQILGLLTEDSCVPPGSCRGITVRATRGR